MVRRWLKLLPVLLLLGWSGAGASVPLCTITGQFTLVNGAPAANAQITFTTYSLQNFGGSIIPTGNASYYTDSSGNLPASVTLPQGVLASMTVIASSGVAVANPVNGGSGAPTYFYVPLQSTADLSALIPANPDPSSVVNSIQVTGPAASGVAVTNPALGQSAPAIISFPTTFNLTAAGGTVTVDANNGLRQTVTLTANSDITFANLLDGDAIFVDVIESATGGFTPAFVAPAGFSISWAGGAPPPSDTSANAHTFYSFVVEGTTLWGAITISSTGGGTFPLSATGNFNDYSATSVGQMTFAPLAAPLPTVAATCSGTCATTYTYEVTCVGDAGGESAPSAPVTATNAATLSNSNSNTVTWAAEAGCYGGYNVYGRVSGSLGVLATVTGTSYQDTGAATPGASPPAYGTLAALRSAGPVRLQNSNPANPAVSVEAPAGQTGDLLDLKVNGTALATFDKNGNETLPNLTISNTLGVSGVSTLAGPVTTKGGLTADSGAATKGSLLISAIGTPSAPSIVSGFTSGTADYYFCAGEDLNGSDTIPSAPTGTTGTTGTMSCGGQVGAVKYYLLRSASNTVPSGTGSYLVGSCTTTSNVSCNVSDANNTLTSYTAQTSDQTGRIQGPLPQLMTFQSSGILVTPPGTSTLQCWSVGGGGGGGGAYGSSYLGGEGAPGAAAECAFFAIPPVTLFTVTVGAGGAAGTNGSAGTAGGNGSESVIHNGTYGECIGGPGGGGAAATSSAAGTGGTAGSCTASPIGTGVIGPIQLACSAIAGANGSVKTLGNGGPGGNTNGAAPGAGTGGYISCEAF